MAASASTHASRRMPSMSRIPWILVCFLLGSAALASASHAQEASDNVLMAVFAHPDDEGTVGPILARHAREGTDVILVIATDGRLGTNDFSGLSAGDSLAAIRRDEMECAASRLGVELIHLDYEDQFNAAEGYDGFIPQLRGFIRDMHRIVAERQPDAIITWGPDGGSNHMDHQLTMSTVTHVVVSGDWDNPPDLYYYGTPASTLSGEAKMLRGVQDEYLTTRIPYADQDYETALESLRCHASQIPPESIDRRMEMYEEGENIVYLWPFVAPTGRSDRLFGNE